MIECVTERVSVYVVGSCEGISLSPWKKHFFFSREAMADDSSETESGLLSNGTIYTLSFTPSSLTSVRNFSSDNTSKLMITTFFTSVRFPSCLQKMCSWPLDET